MALLSDILTGLVVLIHLYIAWLEMIAWTTRGPKTFTSFPAELFPKTRGLAANQGLYNAFLAAGLTWSFIIDNQQWSDNIALFFLSCVAIAGIFGAVTVSMKIFFVQALPALIALSLRLIVL